MVETLRSCLYKCEVAHTRLAPRRHQFSYKVFMFYLDLDEIVYLHRKLWFFSLNRFNWFNFRDHDHLQWPVAAGKNSNTTKQNILAYLRDQGVENGIEKVMLLTNVSTLGYSFNPISFYLCFDERLSPVCSVAEVCNTYGEMKLYLLGRDSFNEGTFRKQVSKFFYISPFADLDSTFEFIFAIPSESIEMRVDDYKDGKRFLLSSLVGKRKVLSEANLLWYGLRFPFITLRIISLIYWQAFMLMLKKIPHHNKNFRPELQKENYHYK
jgi:uncharacterized protein